MKIVKKNNPLFAIICFFIAFQAFAETIETIYHPSDDLKTASKYFSSRLDSASTTGSCFDTKYNKSNISYARPSNWAWQIDKKMCDKNTPLLLKFGNTSSYAYLEHVVHTKQEVSQNKNNASQIYLFVGGSGKVDKTLTVDENIISTVIPSQYKVIDYWPWVNDQYLESKAGTWKIVDNTYTLYTTNVNAAGALFLLENNSTINFSAISQSFEKNDKISVAQEGNKVRITMPLDNLFKSGSAVMQDEGLNWVQQLAKTLTDTTYQEIRVEGHTDNTPIKSKAKVGFNGNWELSTARAANIVQYLAANGIPQNKLSAVGYADSRPLVPNDSEANKAKNRRVEFSIIAADTQDSEK